jgi:DNA polymerase (family 10)
MDPPELAGNKRIAGIFFEVADLLEIKGIQFKPAAYRRAAHTIESLTEDISEIAEGKRLEEIPGVGTHLAAKITEILETGSLSYLERMRKDIPEGLRELAGIEGIGPKKALVLGRELGITSIEKLKEAAEAGLIRSLPGFGEKSEQNIIQSIQTHKVAGARFLLGEILPVAEEIKNQLAGLREVRHISLAGSIRRRKETIGDVDILAASSQPERVMAAFCSLPGVDRILGKGPTKSSIVLSTGIQVDLRVVEERQYWAALQYFTGSKDHNIALRKRALERKWRLNEYGVTDLLTEKPLVGTDERDVYRMLGLPFIEPELRENRGEIEAAESGNLPEIVPYDAVKGDLHIHTTGSDGSHSVADMAAAAQEIGYEYIAICDHAYSKRFARGMSAEKIADQRKQIETVNRERNGIEALAGIECSIMADGKLDVIDSALKDFDIVIASVHSDLKMSPAEMTRRVLTALHNEHVNILGHPTGRIILKREPEKLDLDAIFTTAAEQGVFLEVNGYPSRLDLSDVNCRKAHQHGARFSLGSDAHSRGDLRNMEYGTATARRGWLEAKEIINTLPAADLRRALER